MSDVETLRTAISGYTGVPIRWPDRGEALAALDALLARLEQVERERDALTKRLRDAPLGGDGSHWAGCWRSHIDCAEARVQELERRVVDLVEGHDLERLAKERDRLRDALREIERKNPRRFLNVSRYRASILRIARRALAPDTAPQEPDVEYDPATGHASTEYARGWRDAMNQEHPPDTAPKHPRDPEALEAAEAELERLRKQLRADGHRPIPGWHMKRCPGCALLAPPDTAPSDFQQCKDCAWDLCWQSKSCRLKAAPDTAPRCTCRNFGPYEYRERDPQCAIHAPDTAPKGKVKWSRGTDGGTTGVHRVPPDTAEERE